MTSFHINPETGNAGRCSATKGKCPFGASEEHFSSPDAAREAYEASMNLRHSYSLMTDGTRISRSEDGSISLPAGTYYILPTSDLNLSPTGPVGLGTLSKPYGTEYTSEQAELLARLERTVDSNQEDPVAGRPQGVLFQGEPVVFVADPNMGNNHNGWRDGFVVIGEGLKGQLDEAGFDLSSQDVVEGGVHRFYLGGEGKIETLPEDEVDWDNLNDDEEWSFPIRLNGHEIKGHQVTSL